MSRHYRHKDGKMRYIGSNGKEYLSASAMMTGDSLRRLAKEQRKDARWRNNLNVGEGIMGFAQLGLGFYLLATNQMGAGILGVILIIGGIISITDYKEFKRNPARNTSLFEYIDDVESGRRESYIDKMRREGKYKDLDLDQPNNQGNRNE